MSGPAKRDWRGPDASFSSNLEPRGTYEWEADQRTQDAIFVGALIALAILAGWGLWSGWGIVLDWWLS